LKSSRLFLLGCYAFVTLGVCTGVIGQSGTQVAYNAMFGASKDSERDESGNSASKKLGQLNAFYGVGALVAPLLASFGYAQFGEATVAFVIGALLLVALSLGAAVWRGDQDKKKGRQGEEGIASPSPCLPFPPSPMRSSTFWLMCLVMGLVTALWVYATRSLKTRKI
jgi:hypothetical protein